MMLSQLTQTWRRLDTTQKHNAVLSLFIALILSSTFVFFSLYANETDAKISNGSRHLYSFSGSIKSFAIYCGDPNNAAMSDTQKRCYEDISQPLKMYGFIVPTRVVCITPAIDHSPVQGSETLLATNGSGWYCPPNKPAEVKNSVEYIWFNIAFMFASTAFLAFSLSMFLLYIYDKKKPV